MVIIFGQYPQSRKAMTRRSEAGNGPAQKVIKMIVNPSTRQDAAAQTSATAHISAEGFVDRVCRSSWCAAFKLLAGALT
jgi:hypothetical protein